MSEIPYIRVGTSYFKIVKAPTISGEYIEILVIWNIDTIKQDESKDYIAQIPRYDGFTCIPHHVNYQKIYGTFYNTYFPLSNLPEKGNIDNTLCFLKHIFGKQLDLGLDYLQLLYLKPIQILPILCLVSKQRATGKSTFLKWLKQIFEGNMTYLTNDSFSSQFNADWANKLLICIDEVLFNKEELTERIKYLSTSNVNKMEAKGKDKREVEFFGKFILCSNNEDSFIKIDSDEIRFWVIKVPKSNTDDTNLLLKLIKEIPAFLYYLQNRKLCTPKPLSRMWFEPEQIKTPALLKLVQYNRSRVEKELASLLISVMEKFDLEEIRVCPNDALNALSRTRVRTDLTELRKILKRNWSLEPQENSNKYEKLYFNYDGDFTMVDAKGRYFTQKNYTKMKQEPFNMKTARNISITTVLYDIGNEPVKVINESQWYLSPLRKERKPSFKVNTMLNRWYDFGDQQGGNVVDLIIKLYGFTPREALIYLSKYDVHPILSSFGQQKQLNPIELLEVKPIQHKALKDYLQSRCIKEEIYQKYCKEVHYQVRGKKYFAVGFENQSGGYELRSKFFKGCIGKKDITYIKNNSGRLLVFEGFIDFLSLISHGDNLMNDDTIILNSVANAKNIYSLLDNYPLTSLYLDNDEAGDKYTKALIEHSHRGKSDMREHYQGFKDLNEYLIQASLNDN